MVISLESLDRRTGIIVHELTHQFAFDIEPGTSRDAPVLIEGLAEHQRGRWEEADLHRARVASAAGFIPSVAGLADSDRHLAHAVFDFVSDRSVPKVSASCCSRCGRTRLSSRPWRWRLA